MDWPTIDDPDFEKETYRKTKNMAEEIRQIRYNVEAQTKLLEKICLILETNKKGDENYG